MQLSLNSNMRETGQMSEAASHEKRFLEKMRLLVRRKLARLLSLFFSTTVLFVGSVLLLFSWLDISVRIGTAVRGVGFLFLVAGTAALAIHWLLSLKREKSSYVETALKVEQRLEGADSVLHTATDLRVNEERAKLITSEELADAVVEEAERKTDGVEI